MSLLRLGQPVRIGETVWLGHISAIHRDEVMVVYPPGQFHDGGWRVYQVHELKAGNGTDEWTAPYEHDRQQP